MPKFSLIIAEDSKGNLSVPVIERDKHAVLSMLPDILAQGYVSAHFVKNPPIRTFRNKGKQAAPVESVPQDDESDDVADALSDTPRRRGRPPKS